MDNTSGIPARDIVRFITASGIECHITPINMATLRAINLKAEALFPFPDATPYRLPIPDTDPVLYDNADANPEWIKVTNEIRAKRQEWVNDAVLKYAVRFPSYPTRESLIARFAADLMALRKIAELPEDDFDAVLYHLVLSGNRVTRDKNNQFHTGTSDYGYVINACIQTVPLTQEEIVEGVRFFRINLPEDTVSRLVGGTRSA